MTTFALEPSALGPSFEVLRVGCTTHNWSYASHEHGRAADAARDHELLHPPAVRTCKISNIIAVNVAVRCVKCDSWIEGNAFWSIRKSAQLHESGPCGGGKWELCEMLQSA